MKRILLLLLTLAVSVSVLCACSNDMKTETSQTEAVQEDTTEAELTLSDETAPQGNETAFGMSADQLGESLAGTWVNQIDYTDKLRFSEDLTFEHFMGGDKHDGAATLTEGSGLLELCYDDDASPAKTYIWVDNAANLGANTWYIDGATFAFGGKTYIRDLEI